MQIVTVALTSHQGIQKHEQIKKVILIFYWINKFIDSLNIISTMEMKGVESVVKVSIEEDLLALVSGFGRYQTWQCFLAVVPLICTALSNTNFVFAAAAVNYR